MFMFFGTHGDTDDDDSDHEGDMYVEHKKWHYK